MISVVISSYIFTFEDSDLGTIKKECAVFGFLCLDDLLRIILYNLSIYLCIPCFHFSLQLDRISSCICSTIVFSIPQLVNI